jgi:hypothetical protein
MWQLRASVLETVEDNHFGLVVDTKDKNKVEEELTLNARLTECVNVFYGHPCDHEILEAARVKNARTVVLLSPDCFGRSADSRTLLLFESLKQIRKASGATFSVLLEVKDDRHLIKFQNAIAIAGGKDWTELLQDSTIQSRIFSQAARLPGLGECYFKLLTYTKDTSEPYRLRLPQYSSKMLPNLAFPDLVRGIVAFQRMASSDNELAAYPLVIPIGIWRNGNQVLTNPQSRDPQAFQDLRITNGDDLVVLARSKNDVNRLESAMRRQPSKWADFVDQAPKKSHRDVRPTTQALAESGEILEQ